MTTTNCSTVLILALIFFENLVYGLTSPILPKTLEERGISEVWTGIIFASFPISAFPACILAGIYLEKIGHVREMGWGCVLFAVSSCFMGVIVDMEDEFWTIVLSIVCLSGQGIGSSLLHVASYSYVSVQARNDEEINKGISLQEASCGVGLTISPILGIAIFEVLGFSDLFYITGGMMLPVCVALLLVVKEPSQRSASLSEEDDAQSFFEEANLNASTFTANTSRASEIGM